MFTGNVVGPSKPHGAGLKTLRKRGSPKVPTEDIARMTDFVLKNTFLN